MNFKLFKPSLAYSQYQAQCKCFIKLDCICAVCSNRKSTHLVQISLFQVFTPQLVESEDVKPEY